MPFPNNPNAPIVNITTEGNFPFFHSSVFGPGSSGLFTQILLEGDIEFVSNTEFIVNETDDFGIPTGARLEFQGVSLTFTGSIAGDDLDFTGGNITGFSIAEGGNLLAVVENFDVPVTTLQTAVFAADDDNLGPLDAILSSFSYAYTDNNFGDGSGNFTGNSNNDIIRAGDGQFDSVIGNAGDDILDGGDDFDVNTRGRTVFDTIDYRFDPSAISVNFGLGFANDGFGDRDLIQNFEVVRDTDFDDVLIGGNRHNDGFELFRVGAGNDIIDGGSGFDRVRYTENSIPGSSIVRTEGIFANLSDTSQTFAGRTAASGTILDGFGTIDTVSNIESVQGSSFADVFFGTDNDDQFRAQAGNDHLDGGAGFDEASFAFTGGSLGALVNLSATSQFLNGVFVTAGTARDSFGDTDTLVSIESIQGSRQSDVIVGGTGDERFRLTEGGNDSFDGGGGTDTIVFDPENLSGAGLVATTGARVNLSIFSQNVGGQFVNAGQAIDQFGNTHTISNIENVTGSNVFSDFIVGSSSDNVLLGLGGDFDFLEGGAGDDIIDGGEDFVDGLGFGSDGDLIRGTFDHAIFTNAASGIFVNLSDVAVTQNGQTVQAGQALDGDGSTDTLIGIEGIFGSAFNDIIIDGSENTDPFFILRSSAGDDFFDGGSGFDRIRYREDGARVLVNLSDSAQTLDGVVVQSGTAIDGFGDTDTLINVESIQASNFDDVIVGSDGDDQFRAQGGNDTITGGDGIDQLNFAFTGGNQGALVNLSNAGATLNGIFVAAGTARDTFGNIDTFTGIEDVVGSRFDDFILGSEGDNEFFLTEGGSDTFDGGLGVDTLDIDLGRVAGSGLQVIQNVFIDLGAGIFDDNFGNNHTVSNIENVEGTNFFDTIIGDSADNSLLGKGGSDLLDGGSGNDIIDGGDDFNFNTGGREVFDQIQFSGATSAVAVNLSDVEVTANGVTIAAQSAQDGQGGVDTVLNIEGIFGTSFNDTFIGGNTNNDIFELYRSSGGDDYIDGGTGFDRVRYREDPGRVLVNLSDSAQTLDGVVVQAGTAQETFGGTDTLISIESIQASDFDDFLIGSDANEQFRAQGGDDFIDGGAGDDEVDYAFTFGNGGIFVNLSNAAVTFNGLTQTASSATDTFGDFDTLLNIENVRTSNGNDIVIGNDGDNRFRIGTGGNDFFDGGAGEDTIEFVYDFLAGSGLELDEIGINVDLTLNAILGADGASHVIQNVENVTGSNLHDIIIGDLEDNKLTGRGGDDILTGAGGSDTFIFRTTTIGNFNSANAGFDVNDFGSDIITDFDGSEDSLVFENIDVSGLTITQQGLDVLIEANNGTGSQVLVQGNLVADIEAALDITVEGTGDDDDLDGSTIDDVINLGDGDDTSFGGEGNDIINGGAGNDIIEGGIGRDTLDGGDDIDTVSYATSANGVLIQLFNNIVRAGDAIGDNISNFENILGSDNNDVLRGDAGVNVVTGNDGNDRLEGFDNDDILNGGLGNDLLLGGADNDILNGNDGNDRLNGQTGDDMLFGGLGTDRLLGAAGNDTLDAVDGVNNVLDGGSGADTLIGSEQRDIIRGQASRDTLTGNGGNDALTGGFGPDTFVFSANDGGDVINDFENNFDTIDLSSLGTNFAALNLSTIGGDDALIDYGTGAIRLRDFDVADLDAADFDFV